MRHYCNSSLLYVREECAWVCQGCGKTFDSLEAVELDNEVAEHSDEEEEFI